MKRLSFRPFEYKRNKLYILLAFIRIVLTLIPQTGYIHPDEFFQSLEIFAGDMFGLESHKSWEFNSTFPVRSIIIPSIVVGLPYSLLRKINSYMNLYNMTIVTSYTLVIFPRLFMCLLSFIVDFCLYKICKINHESYREKLIILASSYVMIVYGTRTFSNTVEMVLISMLLYLVADSQFHSDAIIRQNEFLNEKYKRAQAGVDRVKFYKLKTSLPSHSMRNWLLVSVLTVLGIFNRPTFVTFALPAVFFWVHRGIGYKTVSFAEFHYRMLCFIVCSIVSTCFFIVIDSFYFGYLSVAELQVLDISLNNFVVTPLNFIKYNMDVKKLADHGLHPRFLHILVNIPLLFNVLGLVGIIEVVAVAYRLSFGRFRNLPRVHSIRSLMIATLVTPVAALSYFPHQEPRFLIPIIIPLVYLYTRPMITKRTLLNFWWILNAFCIFFYGFVHQAGVYPLTSYLSRHVQSSQQVHLVTSHIYIVPVSLLQQRDTKKIYSVGSTRYMLPKKLVLHELGSTPLPAVFKTLANIQRIKSTQFDSQLYLVIPLTHENELIHLMKFSHFYIDLQKLQTFYPHFSAEALPNFNEYFFHSPFEFAEIFLKSLGLGLFKVNYNNSITYIRDKTTM